VPPYSPELNPVEIAFSVVKGEFRKLHYIKDIVERILFSLHR
jgi:transposase